jgi:hypothetical protein
VGIGGPAGRAAGAAAATAAALRLRRGLGLLDKHERRGQHKRAEKPEDERQTLHNSYLRG